MKTPPIQIIVERIKSRIENYNTTLKEMLKTSEKTEWHRKQIDVLNSRMSELNWLLEMIEAAQ